MDENNQWAVLEIFGHERFVGVISEHQFGGENFIRLDVPQIKDRQAFTKLFGKGAIYSITFIDEKAGNILAQQLEMAPIQLWKFMDWQVQRLLTVNKVEEQESKPPF